MPVTIALNQLAKNNPWITLKKLQEAMQDLVRISDRMDAAAPVTQSGTEAA